jgi:hypothetical protein
LGPSRVRQSEIEENHHWLLGCGEIDAVLAGIRFQHAGKVIGQGVSYYSTYLLLVVDDQCSSIHHTL